jgi:hypothetical protein
MWDIHPQEMDDCLKDEMKENLEEVRRLKLAAFI